MSPGDVTQEITRLLSAWSGGGQPRITRAGLRHTLLDGDAGAP